MMSAKVALVEWGWHTYFHGDSSHKDKWIGQSHARLQEVWLRRNLRWMHRAPILRRIVLRVCGHELDHLRCVDFSSNADHHDDARWVAQDPGNRVLHECGRSYSIKPDDVKRQSKWLRWLWAWRWFSTRHITLESLRLAEALLRDGFVDVPYEEGSGLWEAVNSR